ncbi:MAG: dihydrofolate reductase, partial [Bacteroidales bacterium]|nr:dihydrofolate reductase [Bacteroidales bacterium]
MEQGFSYFLEQFADLRILKYKVPGFENLSLKQKKLVYFLSQAAICGRDILYDQNGKYNLLARKSLENIYKTYSLERKGKEWDEFVIYLKRVWFSNGLHHHYSNDKFIPNFTQQYFKFLCSNSGLEKFLTDKKLSVTDTIKLLENLIFNKDFYAQKIVSETQKDIVKESAVNFYGETVTQKTAEEYYSNIRSRNDSKPVSHGLNSMLDYEQGKLIERTWKLGGMYSSAIEKICSWLVKAVDVAENEEQKEGIRKLIEYYETGDLKAWDEYNILWVKDLKSHIDFINGFIEVYSDPLGMKGTWESIVNFKDIEATRRTIIISENAQWFEDNSPVHNRFKKEKVKGVSAKVITVAMLGGDCYPATPIGINLPNADWIRKEYGSKSVTIDNITYAYAQADLKSGFLEEFSFSE